MLMKDSRLLFQFSAAFPVIMPTMRLGHMFSRVSSSSFLSGIIGWYYVHRRFSFLKHDNLMAHHVKAFWIGHHIVCACLIALTDALMFAMLAFCWQRAWRHCVFRDEMMTESSMRVVPPLSHMFVSGNPEWVFYCWYCPGTRVFANSSLPDCQVIADLWSCWDEPVMPVRCHIRLRKSRVLHATNDSMWNAGKGLARLFLLLSAMSTYVDEQNCTGSCSSCSIRRWMMAVSMWKRCLDCLHVSDLMVTVPCLPRGSSSFHCCLLVSGKHLSGMEAPPEYNHEWCVRAWMRMWTYSAYNDTACLIRVRMVYAVSTEDIFHAYGKDNEAWCAWTVPYHSWLYPLRAKLRNGPWCNSMEFLRVYAFAGMVCLGFRCRMFGCFHELRIGFPAATDHRNGRITGKGMIGEQNDQYE